MRKHKFGIYATCDGEIYHVGKDKEFRDGNTYESKYGNRIYKTIEGSKEIELYAHLSQVFVSIGDKVKAGDLIGIMGNTGMITQLLINDLTMLEIKKEDPTLYQWVLDMQIEDDGVIRIHPDMWGNEEMIFRLNDYLNKHLHYGLFPDSNHLSGKYAVDPRRHLKDNTPPVNTKQSPGGGWQANYGAYLHEGCDFSGRKENIVNGWEDHKNIFIYEFICSID